MRGALGEAARSGELESTAQSFDLRPSQLTSVLVSAPLRAPPQLIWLDSQRRPVKKRDEDGGLPTSSSPFAKNESNLDQLDEYIQVEATNPKLERSTSIYSFRVQLEHHNQLLTCQAKHEAFELVEQLRAQNESEPSEAERWRELPRERSVRLEVHYEPVIELLKDQAQPVEGQPLRITCQAHARPKVLAYEWYLDNQLIEGAAGPELRIAKLGRQLHLREFKCMARNSVGASSSIIRLALRYSPAYVTHLLPLSLQPVAELELELEQEAGQSALPARPNSESNNWNGAEQRRHSAATERAAALRLGRQLALAVPAGSNVTLRCDFDSNPKPLQVEWFKINTGWDLLNDVEPGAADEFIAYGALHAKFVQTMEEAPSSPPPQHSGPESVQLSFEDLDSRAEELELKRRHAESSKHSEQRAYQQQYVVDYDQMSVDLLHELQAFEELAAARPANNHSSAFKGGNKSGPSRAHDELGQIEQLLAEPPIQTPARVYEPLGFQMRPRRARAQHPFARPRLNASSMGTAEDRELVVFSPSSPLSGNYSLNEASLARRLDRVEWRHAQLTSSSITLQRVNGDSVGKYVCRVRGQDRFRWFARAVQVVLRQSPRIISARAQRAPLGSRQLQVECLAQLNGASTFGSPAAHNGTQFLWFRSEKGEPNSNKVSTDRDLGRAASAHFVRETRTKLTH